MTTDTLHPDQLGPGHTVGPFHILEVLGAGNFGRVFKAERGGVLYALKMALRPACAERTPGEEDVDGRLEREALALKERLSHRSLLPVEEMDFWPHANGYRYLASRYVEADTFTEWCKRERPSPARLVAVFSELVDAVGYLHEQGVHHRDLKGDNVLVTQGKEARPLVIDLGAAYVPGARRLTQALPPGALHMLPPEAIAFVRSEVWKEGVRFEQGAAMDLYALGHLLYEALTDHHAFDLKLPTDDLLAAIELVVPRAPHYLNPRVPRALSDLAMRLLAKRPEERYGSARALGQALWEALKQERSSSTWHVPLELPPGGPAPVSPEEAEEREARQREVTHQLKEADAVRALVVKELENLLNLVEQVRPAAEPGAPPRRRRWPLTLAALVTLLALAGGLALRFTLAPSSLEKGNPSVSTQMQPQHASTSPDALCSRPATVLAALLCTISGLGCAGAQVKRPPKGDCPEEATRVMFQELGLPCRGGFEIDIDVNQPMTDIHKAGWGTYMDGPIVGRTVNDCDGMPAGTLVYGRLWTGPGINFDPDQPTTTPGAIIRYTEAVLPDGRKAPVCFALGPYDDHGAHPVSPSATPDGSVRLPRRLGFYTVRKWP